MVSPVEGHADVSPRAASRRTRADAELFDVVIIGAGISGVGAAIRLRQAGFERIVVLEKADGIGGTWRDNTYPGCACDVPSALYSYTFAQKADWSRVFAPQAEIAAYVRETPVSAEVAFLVADSFQGHGIATILLAHLATVAEGQGITTFTAEVLPGNFRMIDVFRPALPEPIQPFSSTATLLMPCSHAR